MGFQNNGPISVSHQIPKMLGVRTQISSSDLLFGHPTILIVFFLNTGASRKSITERIVSIMTLLSKGWESSFGSTFGASVGLAEFKVTSPSDCGSGIISSM